MSAPAPELWWHVYEADCDEMKGHIQMTAGRSDKHPEQLAAEGLLTIGGQCPCGHILTYVRSYNYDPAPDPPDWDDDEDEVALGEDDQAIHHRA